MKIKELILKLQEAYEECGQCEVRLKWDDHHIEFERVYVQSKIEFCDGERKVERVIYLD